MIWPDLLLLSIADRILLLSFIVSPFEKVIPGKDARRSGLVLSAQSQLNVTLLNGQSFTSQTPKANSLPPLASHRMASALTPSVFTGGLLMHLGNGVPTSTLRPFTGLRGVGCSIRESQSFMAQLPKLPLRFRAVLRPQLILKPRRNHKPAIRHDAEKHCGPATHL
jgi:hypothetical protein